MKYEITRLFEVFAAETVYQSRIRYSYDRIRYSILSKDYWAINPYKIVKFRPIMVLTPG